MTLSVVIAAKNEEAIIRRCLESIKDIADEIIIIDNMSTDNTATICKKYTSRIFKEKGDALNLIPYLHNKGIEKATKEWVLILDADVEVPKEAAREIKARIQDKRYNGFYVIHQTYCLGKLMRSRAWNHNILKLFRRGLATFPCDRAHCELKIKGKVGTIKNKVIHYSHPTLETVVQKMLKYAAQDAQKIVATGRGGFLNRNLRHVGVYSLCIEPFLLFLHYFIRGGGYQDGLHGLIMAMLMMFYLVMERAKVIELRWKAKWSR